MNSHQINAFFISEVPKQVILGKIMERVRKLIEEESMRCVDLVHPST